MDDRHVASIMSGFTAITYCLMKLLIESETLEQGRVLAALDELKDRAGREGNPATAIPIDHLLRLFADGVDHRALLKAGEAAPGPGKTRLDKSRLDKTRLDA